MRIIAIGDIHGCSTALASLLSAIAPLPDDVIVPLGDFIDRGIDSKGVVDQLIDLQRQCRLIPILGNHEEMMMAARQSRPKLTEWMEFGGIATLDSYGDRGLKNVPETHWSFLASCRSFFETDSHVFLHANYKPDLPFQRLDSNTLRWLSLSDYLPDRPHCSGKKVIVGHTPQPEILNLGYLICIDTGCCDARWLTALDVGSGEVWQVDERGISSRPRSRCVLLTT